MFVCLFIQKKKGKASVAYRKLGYNEQEFENHMKLGVTSKDRICNFKLKNIESSHMVETSFDKYCRRMEHEQELRQLENNANKVTFGLADIQRIGEIQRKEFNIKQRKGIDCGQIYIDKLGKFVNDKSNEFLSNNVPENFEDLLAERENALDSKQRNCGILPINSRQVLQTVLNGLKQRIKTVHLEKLAFERNGNYQIDSIGTNNDNSNNNNNNIDNVGNVSNLNCNSKDKNNSDGNFQLSKNSNYNCKIGSKILDRLQQHGYNHNISNNGKRNRNMNTNRNLALFNKAMNQARKGIKRKTVDYPRGSNDGKIKRRKLKLRIKITKNSKKRGKQSQSKLIKQHNVNPIVNDLNMTNLNNINNVNNMNIAQNGNSINNINNIDTTNNINNIHSINNIIS